MITILFCSALLCTGDKYAIVHTWWSVFVERKFCQDPLESYFGKQCYKGRRNDNPSVKEFIDNVVSLRVQGSAALEPLRGNCSRKRQPGPLQVDETPLPKRPRNQ